MMSRISKICGRTLLDMSQTKKDSGIYNRKFCFRKVDVTVDRITYYLFFYMHINYFVEIFVEN